MYIDTSSQKILFGLLNEQPEDHNLTGVVCGERVVEHKSQGIQQQTAHNTFKFGTNGDENFLREWEFVIKDWLPLLFLYGLISDNQTNTFIPSTIL